MKTNGKSKAGILIAVVVLLFAALAVGIGIKLSQPQRDEVEPQVEKQETKPVETRPQEESNQSEMTAEDEEFLMWLDDEIEKLEEEEASERMRDRFEEWRESGDVELPQLSLD
ncbi:MAG: hypothetical protein ACYS32_13640 [Planctomycetota bacterium]